MNEDDIKNNIEKYSNVKLADIIISYRYLGFFQMASEAAMTELGVRRSNGDTFEYEKYIEENLATLPKLEFKAMDFGNLLKNIGLKK